RAVSRHRFLRTATAHLRTPTLLLDGVSAAAAGLRRRGGPARVGALRRRGGSASIAPTSAARRSVGSHVEHDLAGGAPLLERAQRLARLLEWETLADDRPDEALRHHARDRRPHLAVELRLAHDVGAPSGADHL